MYWAMAVFERNHYALNCCALNWLALNCRVWQQLTLYSRFSIARLPGRGSSRMTSNSAFAVVVPNWHALNCFVFAVVWLHWRGLHCFVLHWRGWQKMTSCSLFAFVALNLNGRGSQRMTALGSPGNASVFAWPFVWRPSVELPTFVEPPWKILKIWTVQRPHLEPETGWQV